MTVLRGYVDDPEKDPSYDLVMVSVDGANLLTFRLPELALAPVAMEHAV